MLEKYFVHPDTLNGIRNCWLGEEIDKYVEWRVEQGYGPGSIYRRVPVVKRFGEFAWAEGARSFGDLPEQVESFVSHWMAERDSGQNAERTRKFRNEVRGPVEQLLSLVLPDFVRRGRQPLGIPAPFVTQAPDFLLIYVMNGDCENRRSSSTVTSFSVWRPTLSASRLPR